MRTERHEIQVLIRDFSSKMRAKLLKKLGRGWHGWEADGIQERMESDLLLHLRLALKGDHSQWVDVANYAAFLDYHGSQSTGGNGNE